MSRLQNRAPLLLLVLFSLASLVLPLRLHAETVQEFTDGESFVLSSGKTVYLAGIDPSFLKKRRFRVVREEAMNYLSGLFALGDVRVEASGLPAARGAREQVFIFVPMKVKSRLEEDVTSRTEALEALVNLEMVRRGYALKRRGYKGRFAEAFAAAEHEARQKALGRWRS